MPGISFATDKVPVVIGYYRYTDILFEYHKTFANYAEVSAFKAFVSNAVLGDPIHPFHDKEKGVEFYIGMLPNGQLRLMFSSAQVEYARYWLHAMGLTKRLLPLPDSEYLLTTSILRSISTVHVKTPEEIKKANRMVDKNNRKLKGTDSALASFRIMFDKVRDFYASRKATWLAIDIEAWEMDHTVVTECGWSYSRWDGGTEIADHGHYIVKENRFYTNGKYVPNQRDNYKFGESNILSKAAFKKAMLDMMIKFQESGPLFLVFHDCSQDIKFLKGPYFDAPLDNLVYFLPSDVPESGIFVVDTSELFGALEGDIAEKRSLGMMCKLLKIDVEHLHNAGNDAHYTLLALKSMASGNQIDAQREERWPNRTEASAEAGNTFKVIHKPWELDSDHSDMEGAFGRPANPEAVAKHMAGLSISDDEDDDGW